MTFSAILVDDEQSALSILSKLINTYCPQIEIVDTCRDVEEAVLSIKKHQPKLLFLDIEMPTYAGYEILSFFESIDFEIIFVTAYDQYAIKAFEISAVDYLLKPVVVDRLKLAVKRFCDRKMFTNTPESYAVLKESLQKKEINKIVVPHQGDRKILFLSEIVAIEANEAYSSIYDNLGNRYVMSKNLKHFEELLSEIEFFFRSHKSWIVNTNHIKSYSKTALKILLNHNIEAKLSKYRKAEFQNKYNL